jgi:hypothetical protein
LTFSGNLIDSSGNGNDGTATGQLFTADRAGHLFSAYLFDGASNYITIPDNPTLNPASELTIAMWIRIDSSTGNYPLILSKGAPQTGNYSDREYLVTWKDNLSCPYFQIYSAGDGSGQHELIENACHLIGQWVFFAGVIDRTNHRMQLYINGVLTQEAPDSYSTFNISSHPLLVGWTEEIENDYGKFKGAMDDLKIYNRALTANEILVLSGGTPPPPPPPPGHGVPSMNVFGMVCLMLGLAIAAAARLRRSTGRGAGLFKRS